MQLCTKRLQLREFTKTDFEDVFAYESDPLVVQYVCYGPYTEEECQRQLEFHVAHYVNKKGAEEVAGYRHLCFA